jgi:hypothetical protein
LTPQQALAVVLLTIAACGVEDSPAGNTRTSYITSPPDISATTTAPEFEFTAESSSETSPFTSPSTLESATTLPGDADLSASPLMVYPRSCWTYPTKDECDANAPVEESLMAAEVEGEITIRDGCVYLTYAGSDHPVIFGYGTAWDEAQQAVVLNNGELVRNGDRIYNGGGGGVTLRPDADEWYGPELAAGLRRCLSNPDVADTIAELGWGGGTVSKIEPP